MQLSLHCQGKPVSDLAGNQKPGGSETHSQAGCLLLGTYLRGSWAGLAPPNSPPRELASPPRLLAAFQTSPSSPFGYKQWERRRLGVTEAAASRVRNLVPRVTRVGQGFCRVPVCLPATARLGTGDRDTASPTTDTTTASPWSLPRVTLPCLC